MIAPAPKKLTLCDHAVGIDSRSKVEPIQAVNPKHPEVLKQLDLGQEALKVQL